MFNIIQSNHTEKLVEHLLSEYKSKQQSIFEPFVVIVPSMVLGDWLDKTIASKAGISTLVVTKFWGQYQWTMMQDVLACHNQYLLMQDPTAKTLNVPEVAVLSSRVMQWRLFGYFTHYKEQILADEKHPLNPLLTSLIGELNNDDINELNKEQQDARLWQLASDLARVFNRYLTYREDWLDKWSVNKQLNVKAIIKEKDSLTARFDRFAKLTPPWLQVHYEELELAQRFLWTNLFAGVYQHRVALDKAFWQALKQNDANERAQLPKVLRIFTIQQLPQTELNFLQRLSQYIDITLLHYNPSKLFWADIVDKSWLQRQKIINPQSVFLRDYGHSLLSRLGKQSRDTFAMLANLSGNEDYGDIRIHWQDRFDEVYNDDAGRGVDIDADSQASSQTTDTHDISNENGANQHHQFSQPLTLLKRLQDDVLMLDESETQQATAVKVSQEVSLQLDNSSSNDKTTDANELDETPWYDEEVLNNKRFNKQREWLFPQLDNSLSIHSCHSLQRQLEVLRIMIGRWLNEDVLTFNHKKRHLSDIVVLLPDVEKHYALISSVFGNDKGPDGLTLPAKVTGVVDSSIRQLWEAIIGFYKLLGSDSSRFEASQVLDWLMLPPLYTSFGLTHEQMSRGCDLLVDAGFIRGFDEAHLRQSLDSADFDYRFTLAHALDKLVLGLVMPEATASSCLYPLQADDWTVNAIPEKTLPFAEVSFNDAPIIDALCRIYSGLAQRRDDYKKYQKAEQWLREIETQVIHEFFSDIDQTRSMRAIYNAMNGFKTSLRANSHYQNYTTVTYGKTENDEGFLANNNTVNNEQKFSQVENLELKLSFMLDSIEDELESQQVSAEPTGVITFGRFGALRNVPFELVVMLNMDLSEFPARDKDNRYDLMKAGVARRGDRVSEDDDNGAFLDALLCARSNCWIFYNGQSLTDTHEHLPANPVSELLQFLQGEVQWQINATQNYGDELLVDANAETLKRYLPKLVKQWLVTEHPALPFDRSLFEWQQPQASLPSQNSNQNTDSQQSFSKNLPIQDTFNQGRLSEPNNNTNDDTEIDTPPTELLAQLDEAMLKTKLAQRQQFPPAQLWQSVRAQLKQRELHNVELKESTDDDAKSYGSRDYDASDDSRQGAKQKPIINLPTSKQYQRIAQLFTSPSESAVSLSALGRMGAITDEFLQFVTFLMGDKRTNISTNTATIECIEAESSHYLQSLFNIAEIDIDSSLIYQVRHPVKSFLREQQVSILSGEAELATEEPLALDGLTKYQLNEQLLKALSFDGSSDMLLDSIIATSDGDELTEQQKLLYENIMPAGVSRLTTLPKQQQNIQLLCDEFSTILANEGVELTNEIEQQALKDGAINDTLGNTVNCKKAINIVTTTKEQITQIDVATLAVELDESLVSQLPNWIKIKGTLPTGATKQWLNVLPNSARAEHLLKFWLSHLYWQVARHTTEHQVVLEDGVSIWHYSKSGFKKNATFKLMPIKYEQAAVELIKWSIFANLAGQLPIILFPVYALQYIEKYMQAIEKDEQYYPRRGDFAEWFSPSYNSDTIFETCAQHPIWQYVLQNNDRFKPLSDSLNALAMPLYKPMFDALIDL